MHTLFNQKRDQIELKLSNRSASYDVITISVDGELFGKYDLPAHQVRMHVQGHRWALMPELLLDVFDVFALVDQKAIVSMPQIVKTDLFNPRFFQRG